MSPAWTLARRSQLVAATMRGLALMLVSLPTRRISRSWSARSSFAWRAGDISPTSSRNSVPALATSNSPALSRIASVNAPRTWPKSSDSSSVSVSAAQLTDTNGWPALALCSWIMRTTNSLPVPLSPQISTPVSSGATRAASSSDSRMPPLTRIICERSAY